MKKYIIIENCEEHDVDELTYDRLIVAEKIYFCDECGVAHAVQDWADVESYLNTCDDAEGY